MPGARLREQVERYIIAFGQQAREELDRIQFSQERTEHLQAEKHRLYVLARDHPSDSLNCAHIQILLILYQGLQAADLSRPQVSSQR